MAANIGQIAQLLDATLDPQQHRKAENALRQEEKKPNYSLMLLQIVASDPLPLKTRLAAALAFKNFVRHNYVDEDGNYKLPADEVATIKQEIVGLMISTPSNIQSQLGEAISLIADSDFWTRWDTLTADLVQRLSKTDSTVTGGVLEVAHSIFKRWRPLFRSDDLYTEINHVLRTFGEPFVALVYMVDSQIDANKDNAKELKGWMEVMGLIAKLFYDLSCHDLPPIFEAALPQLVLVFDKYLSYTNPIFDGDDDEASVLENVKADYCELLQLYTHKYPEDFKQYVQTFTNKVWELLSSLGPEKKYDLLVSKALQFLTAVASVDENAQNFNNEQVLGTIVEKVILPNVALRESDIEMFEDEPIEFIRRDLEGSDTDSRRRSATDFLRKLLERYEQLVTQVVFKYIEHYLNLGKSDWKAKDTAIYLFLSIAAKGAVTSSAGVVTVNQYVNVVQFFQDHVASDLLADTAEPISKVDAIKYLHNFRSQLDKAQWQAAFQPLVKNMASSDYVVYTYAAIAVERVLHLTDSTGQHIFTREDIQPFASDLLEHLFTLVEKDPSPARLQENEFLMRCIMRVLIVLKDGSAAILDRILTHLINITNVIKANPSNPRFYYYHFEAIGALVKFNGPTSGSKLLERLWEPFSYILTEDVTEFVPYVFQVFSAVLELDSEAPVPESFKTLFDPILEPAAWEVKGNVPALGRFLSASIPKLRQEIIAGNKLEKILILFQLLCRLKKTTNDAYKVLEAVVSAFDGAILDPYFGEIMRIVYTRLEEDRSDSHKQLASRFYHLVSAKDGLGADYVSKHSQALHAKAFTGFYLTIVLPTTKTFARPVDRKLGVISYAKTLGSSNAFAEQYAKGWSFTANSLLDLIKNEAGVATGQGDVINEADVDDIGFGVGFTPLLTLARGPRDEYPQIVDVNAWVGQYLKSVDQQHNGIIQRFAAERLEDPSKSVLAAYLQ
ncbi:Cse1-domain-containing protein [Thozetella sp. PMI_491]|nr:Cse1-domain-containing protein [Thozetella sp. PMI_491]